MIVASFFDGMRSGRICSERAGLKIDEYYSSEIDPYALKVANKNYWEDEENQLGDITEIDTSELKNIDLIIGGSPCQSFSRSGDGSGFDGKSKLFWEFARMVKELKPKYFLLENVLMKKEWEDVISNELGVKPVKINSTLFSAQKRPRLYWTNIPFSLNIPDKNIQLKDIITGTHKKINNHPLVIKSNGGKFWIKNATKKGYLIAEEGDSVNLEVPKSKTRRGRVGKGKTNTLNTACNYAMVLNGDLVELNIVEYERLQNLPDNYTKCDGVSLAQRKKMIGNGWTVDVIVHILKGLKED